MIHSEIVSHGLELSTFGTQVRSAADVLWRGTPLFPLEPESRTVAEQFGLDRPTAEDVEAAAATAETTCREILRQHVGETLPLPVARAITLLRGWARLHHRQPNPRPLSVCFGHTMKKVRDRQRLTEIWVNTEGKDGCLVVFEGRGRNCPSCHASRRTRLKTIEAEGNANYRGLLEHRVWYPDRTTAVVRIGQCACGNEFQTSRTGAGLRQSRCDECRKRHRTHSNASAQGSG